MPSRKASCNCGQLTVTHEGPDPARRSLCQCYECQKRTGSVLSVQARIPREQVTIEGRSTTWAFPVEGAEPVGFRSCDSGGATYHFCPECGSTVYWDISVAPDVVGVAIGSFTDPTFPPPMISGFEAYGHPWAMNASSFRCRTTTMTGRRTERHECDARIDPSVERRSRGGSAVPRSARYEGSGF